LTIPTTGGGRVAGLTISATRGGGVAGTVIAAALRHGDARLGRRRGRGLVMRRGRWARLRLLVCSRPLVVFSPRILCAGERRERSQSQNSQRFVVVHSAHPSSPRTRKAHVTRMDRVSPGRSGGFASLQRVYCFGLERQQIYTARRPSTVPTSERSWFPSSSD
jgi:hypothetical protein